ncbi:acyl-CoA reductase-like NAD-dependent aldehyde dehydrogenase/ketosteroid isomerase-like protein [Gordonia amarae]|nr:aldehyde dehydrogenase family protein [Gordonia amarae]MCS3876537.1 acyl-CoA reductase-like NAD-dependent aldehyde dehydrogenase/ketosteroid isomerase-like protein [Gordonia amarae]
MPLTTRQPGGLDRRRFYIGGRWVDSVSDRVHKQTEAATGKVIGTASLGGEADIDAAVRAARWAFDNGPWGRTTPAERAAVLHRFADSLERRAAGTSTLVSRENGMPIGFSEQVNGGVPAFLVRMYADMVAGLDLEVAQPSGAGSTLVRREPLGVVGAIVPWNFPQALAAFKFAPALAAGNTVVLKPSPETALDAYIFADAAAEAGLPEGVFNVVLGDRDAGAALVSHPLVDKIAFTGSTEAGRAIGAECGRLIRPVTLELGGKSPGLFLEDADLDTFLAALDGASFLNNSQTCTTQSRILVDRSRYAEVVDALADYADSHFTIGDPLDPAVTLGPMASAGHHHRVHGYIKAAKKTQARLVAGGRRPKDLPDGYFLEPTVFADVAPGDRLAREEVFGPVIAVTPFDDEADAIRLANETNFGLAAVVYSSDEDHALRVAQQIRSGTVGLNYYLLDLGAPFGGYKESGIGRELGGELGLEPYLQYKSIYASAKYLTPAAAESAPVQQDSAAVPSPADTAPSNAADVVEAYFACVTAGNSEALADLFADDAVLQNAAGTLYGAAAIARMYRTGVTPGAMRPSPRRMVVDGNHVSVEIDLDAGGSTVTLADFFTVVDGKISRLAIYSLTLTDGKLFDKVGKDPGNQ